MAATAPNVPERSIFHRIFWPEDQAAYSAGFSRSQDHERAITAILKRTDHKDTPFKWRVYWVAALGFLTDSYNLFASNVVLPALSFLYWNTPSKQNMMAFNVATLLGSIVGQIVFGIAVDICMPIAVFFQGSLLTDCRWQAVTLWRRADDRHCQHSWPASVQLRLLRCQH